MNIDGHIYIITLNRYSLHLVVGRVKGIPRKGVFSAMLETSKIVRHCKNGPQQEQQKKIFTAVHPVHAGITLVFHLSLVLVTIL